MKIKRVIETCIYAENLDRVEEFYGNTLGLEQISKESGRHIFYKCGTGMLLIFNPDHTSTEQTYVNGSPVPLHGAKGPGHLAFEVEHSEIPGWKKRLQDASIEIESQITWPNGFVSIYFRDPAGNSIELVAAGLWE
jgi:catechol 2,3-dioxygenase-like lactoylglutathione lyase family enzyme